MHKDIKEVLYSEEYLDNVNKKLGKEITEFYQGRTPTLIGVLKGASMFMMDLVRYIDLDIEFDFIKVSSYEGTTSTGNIRVKKEPDMDITGKDLLFVEDIIDTGRTLKFLSEYFLNKGAKSVEFVTLFDKKARRVVDFHPRFTGIDVPDYFIVGYGLDFNEKYRNLPYVGILKEEMYK